MDEQETYPGHGLISARAETDRPRILSDGVKSFGWNLLKFLRIFRTSVDTRQPEVKTDHAHRWQFGNFAMSKKVSDEVRKVLDNPATRYRIVDTWVLVQKKEELEARKAARLAAKNSQGSNKK